MIEITDKECFINDINNSISDIKQFSTSLLNQELINFLNFIYHSLEWVLEYYEKKNSKHKTDVKKLERKITYTLSNHIFYLMTL